MQLSGIFFEKTAMNMRTGQNPATVASPGDTLRYTLRVQTTANALNGFAIRDEIDARVHRLVESLVPSDALI